MPRRLFTLVALMLAALLPLEAGIAASGCLIVQTDAVAMAGHAMSDDACSGEAADITGSADDCAAYCLALCQMVPFAAADPSPSIAFEGVHPRAGQADFQLSAATGPEPPPPRLVD